MSGPHHVSLYVETSLFTSISLDEDAMWSTSPVTAAVSLTSSSLDRSSSPTRVTSAALFQAAKGVAEVSDRQGAPVVLVAYAGGACNETLKHLTAVNARAQEEGAVGKTHSIRLGRAVSLVRFLIRLRAFIHIRQDRCGHHQPNEKKAMRGHAIWATTPWSLKWRCGTSMVR